VRSRFSIPIRDPEGKPFQRLAYDAFRYGMRTLKLLVAYLVVGTLELGDDLRLQRSIGSTSSRVPWETNTGGLPL
jgi:hypothetical protein